MFIYVPQEILYRIHSMFDLVTCLDLKDRCRGWCLLLTIKELFDNCVVGMDVQDSASWTSVTLPLLC